MPRKSLTSQGGGARQKKRTPRVVSQSRNGASRKVDGRSVARARTRNENAALYKRKAKSTTARAASAGPKGGARGGKSGRAVGSKTTTRAKVNGERMAIESRKPKTPSVGQKVRSGAKRIAAEGARGKQTPLGRAALDTVDNVRKAKKVMGR